MEILEINIRNQFEDTPTIEYVSEEIDEYLVIVNDENDWEEIHEYIINENDIDGIPNRRINCLNIKNYSLRSSVYEMSIEEAKILKEHPKIEDVVLNPDKYPQPCSNHSIRYKKNVAFNKPSLVVAFDSESIKHTNGIRSNWSHLFVNNLSSEPFRGVGIATTSTVDMDIEYSLTGKNVDAVIIDSGIGAIHPEFIGNNGITRVKDVVLDGPYKIDPDYFISRGLTYVKVIDGIEIGVGIATTSAREWWSASSKRSTQFQSLGTISINSSYTLQHAHSKETNSNNNQIIDGHGTACASQIGGKSFGLAFDCNIWNIRISLGGAGGLLSASTALDVCTIFHNAKKISQSGNPDPTLINNSYGFVSSTGNTNGSTYTHGYRGSNLQYVGNGSNTNVPQNAGACRNTKTFTYNINGTSYLAYYSGTGQYAPTSSGTSDNSSAENAISAGCIVVTSAGNTNQKLSNSTDIDFNNWYNNTSTYVNRVCGVQKGFSGEHLVGKGSIRVGALDCSVEPSDSKQGSPPFSIRKVCYSANGPMIDIWAPGEMTMAAGYTSSYEDYPREDDSSFYDSWFNGTSAASPNACSVIALYLESNRKANQNDVRAWLQTSGSDVPSPNLSDPYPDPILNGYWSFTYDSTIDYSSLNYDSYNVRGNGNLRGAPPRVIKNPYANNTIPSISNLEISGISFSQS